jgi:hypothetical protein
MSGAEKFRRSVIKKERKTQTKKKSFRFLSPYPAGKVQHVSKRGVFPWGLDSMRPPSLDVLHRTITSKYDLSSGDASIL